MKQLLFSITKKDFIQQFFTVGGHGGSGKDTSNNGVRLIHKDSGAVGEGREHRSAGRNREEALKRLVQTPRFKGWHKLKCAQLMGSKSIDEIVEEQMVPANIKEEYYTP